MEENTNLDPNGMQQSQSSGMQTGADSNGSENTNQAVTSDQGQNPEEVVVEPEMVDVTETPQFKAYEAQQVADATFSSEDINNMDHSQPEATATQESPMMAENPALRMQGIVTDEAPVNEVISNQTLENNVEPSQTLEATVTEAPITESSVQQPNETQPAPTQVEVKKKSNILNVLLGITSLFAISGIALSIFLFLPAGANLFGSQTTSYILIMLMMGLVGGLGFAGVATGMFKTLTAKKEDSLTKKKGFTVALTSTITLLVSLVVFAIALVNFNALNGPKTPENIADLILTDPTVLRDLTAPVEVKFDASGIPFDSEKFEVISYLWDFTDGDRATGERVTHLFTTKPDSGVYNVQLTILYRNLSSGEQVEQKIVKPVAISNQEALVDFSFEPAFGGAPITITFDASGSTDPDGDIVAYEWDLNGDDVIDKEGEIVKFTYQENGKFNVTLNVTDTNGEVTSVTKQLNLLEEGGFLIRFELAPDEDPLRANLGYQFDASSSAAPDGKITGYSWNFGDGTNVQQGQKVTHSYRREGIYTLALTVSTDKDTKQTKEFRIQVGDLDSSPNAVITSTPANNNGTITGNAPLRVNFSANESTDPNNDIVDFAWDFNGDGISDALGANAEFTYEDAGEYRAVLVLTDSDGNSDTKEVVIKVAERGVQAKVNATPLSGEVPLTVAFDASATTSDQGDPVVAFDWDFGDGSPVRRDNAQITYVYKQVGTYTASVTAQTESGKKSTAKLTISVNPVSLKACFTMSRQVGTAPVTVEFSSKCARGSVSSYIWDFGDGNQSIERQPVHTFTNPGTYQVKLTVEKDNVVDSFTDTVQVN